ncbi:MAG: DUF4194 domain-containing protein [Gammaproteobacteria bacterium]|jgi:hypothetical protein|nr:DUF4194 domain-containing protein [Gammaproteobacteria bacterium]
MNQTTDTDASADLGGLLVLLLKGVLYQDGDARRWAHLLQLQNRVRDYVAVLGLELILDEAEGYAFLRSRQEETTEADNNPNQELPRLITRRQLSFPVSLLLALLRKKLAECDAGGGDTRLVLTRDDLVELLRLFLPDSSNEAKLVDQIERHISKVVELGFLRQLKSGDSKAPPSYEVRRIIKAFVDAQWLSAFDARLEDYRRLLAAQDENNG